MNALLSKELLSLRPFLIATVLCFLLQLLHHALSAPMLGGYVPLVTENLEMWITLGGLLSFSAAHNTISRELLDGHIHFLDGLPLGRTKIFAAKWLAALSVPLGLAASMALVKALSLSIVQDLTLMSWHQPFGVVLQLYIVALLGFFGAGLLFSYFGELGYGVLFLGLIFLMIAGELNTSLEPISIAGYDTIVFERGVALYHFAGIRFWFSFFVISTLIAGRIFLRPTAALLSAKARVRPRLARGLLVSSGGLVLLLTLLSVSNQLQTLKRSLDLDSSVTSTERFRILFLREDLEVTRQLALIVDDIDDMVQKQLGSDHASRLDLELIDTGRYHAGEFTGGKVRVLPGEDSAMVLAHELAHAHVDQLTKSASVGQGDHFRFFNEGLAMWVEAQIMGDGDVYEGHRQWAAAVWAKEQHAFELLVDEHDRSVRFDTFEIYPLGMVFIEALVELYGPRAPGKLLRALAEIGEDAGQKVQGIALWYGLFAQTEFSLDRVVSAYEARLQRYHAKWPAPKLQLSGRPYLGERNHLKITAQSERKLYCRFRPRANVDHANLHQVRVTEGRCEIPGAVLGGLSYWYQLGYQLHERAIVYGEWTSAPGPKKFSPL